MSRYSNTIAGLRTNYEQTENLKSKIDELVERLAHLNESYVVMLEAQQLLASVSDENTTKVLDYIMGIINKALSELFPHDNRHVSVEKKMHNGQYAHINITLQGSNGYSRDLTLQSGTGLRQVISFLFVLSIIEVRKGRRLLIMDELLSGLHPEAKRVVMDILQIFAEDGFQFAFVEYGVNDIGKIYIVEKPNETATITPMNGSYNNEVFVFNRPVEDVDMSITVDETSGEDEV